MKRFNRRYSYQACSCLAGFVVLLVLQTPSSAAVFVDTFDDNTIDSTYWAVSQDGGPQVAEVNQQIEILIPANSSGSIFSGTLRSLFLLRGDFDIQVDYHLMEWPYANGVRTSLKTDYPSNVERTSFGTAGDHPGLPREVYYTCFADGLQGVLETADTMGTLRMVRSGAILAGYYRSEGEWVLLHSGLGSMGDATVELTCYSGDSAFTGHAVHVALDNFVISSGQLVWPPVHAERSTWGLIKALYR